jgi:hypothetical protein
VVRVAYALAAGPGVLDFQAATWARWDSGNYADIAKNGYYIASCASQNRAPHGDLCSPAAWYPAYPYLGRWLSSATGLSLDHAFVLIAHLAFVGVLYVIWLGFFRGRVTVRSATLLVMAAFFPGAIYFLASFPVSLLVCGLCLQIFCFLRSRWLIGAVFGALASLCYPIAVVLPITSAIWVLLAVRSRSRDAGAADARAALAGDDGSSADPVPLGRQVGLAAAVGAIISSGTVAVFVVHQIVLGDWAASIHEQQKFGGTLYNPVLNWGHTVVKRNSWIQVTYPETAKVIAAQTLLVTVLIATCVVLVAFVKKGRTVHDVGLLVMMAGLWLLPLSSNIETGLYRRVGPLVPAVYLLRRAPWPVTAALTFASVGVWWWMAPKFNSGALI